MTTTTPPEINGQQTLFDPTTEPATTTGPRSACCRQPLTDRRWGVWTCPACGRAYTLPTTTETTS